MAVGPGRKSVLSAVGVRLIQMDHPLVLPANPSCTSLPDPEAPSVRHELPPAVGFGSHYMYNGLKKARKVFEKGFEKAHARMQHARLPASPRLRPPAHVRMHAHAPAHLPTCPRACPPTHQQKMKA